jgi:hypothetical protein
MRPLDRTLAIEAVEYAAVKHVPGQRIQRHSVDDSMRRPREISGVEIDGSVAVAAAMASNIPRRARVCGAERHLRVRCECTVFGV